MFMKKNFPLLLLLCMCLLVKAENNSAVIIEYLPAPGQFVNLLPAVGTDSAAAPIAAQQNIDRNNMITLGGFGGFVKAKFNNRVMRVDDKAEILILGNAHTNGSEPGVVWVSYDANENGIADDEWYELAGSEDNRSVKNYTITYYKPSAADDNSTKAIDNYIRWKDNNNATGWIPKNTFHNQSYYPAWVTADSISFTGTLLPDNAVDVNGDGSYYSLVPYEWGYVDNYPYSEQDKNIFDIDNAIDSAGNKVTLPGVDFIMIQSAIHAIHGNIGESSTEVSKICEAEQITTSICNSTIVNSYVVDKELIFTEPLSETAYLFSVEGRCLFQIDSGVNRFDLKVLPRGIYIIKSKNFVLKIVV